MDDILERIIDYKQSEIAEALRGCELAELRERAEGMHPCRDFLKALSGYQQIRVIAEIKKASPSAGVIRPDFDPESIAKSYARGGAACLSVLTDQPSFQGSLDHLRAASKAVDLPILRKDFVLHEVQVYEARLAGASAVLLIAECLDAVRLTQLVGVIERSGMAALVELYEPRNLPAVLASGAKLIGINNRNLRTFKTDLAHTIDVAREIPRDRVIVSESGIGARADIDRLAEAGIAAVLVGETFMRAPDPGAKLAELLAR